MKKEIKEEVLYAVRKLFLIRLLVFILYQLRKESYLQG